MAEVDRPKTRAKTSKGAEERPKTKTERPKTNAAENGDRPKTKAAENRPKANGKENKNPGLLEVSPAQYRPGSSNK
uniref:High mobility group nucleosomal binding domain 3 n=2 Tax=Bursaphelenchus xylophilus TaxID=6326 RepID=A0A1I7SJ28_BURXY